MIQLKEGGAFIKNGAEILDDGQCAGLDSRQLRQNTIAYSILKSHNTAEDMQNLKLKFDAMASHDITYVGIIQTARASGLREFPLEYVLTNCHNSLCAVGGTINEDDHLFGLSAARKYGGIYVPAHQAVIHQYMREMEAGCGRMILGSDSHTRYGALGTMAIGEGGPELVKQLLGRTYDIALPQVVAVYLTGAPRPGVGPQDVALAIIGAVFKNGYVKNKVMEFIGDGIQNLGMEYRNGIDVMTTETTCLSSVWMTDERTREYLKEHGREEMYRPLSPNGTAYYDGLVTVDLSKVKPMIALPFHPSNTYTIEELCANLSDILHEVELTAKRQLGNPDLRFSLQDKIRGGRLVVDQGVIAGCAGGTFDNICCARDILRGHSIGSGEFSLSVYPSSQPTFLSLVENGAIADLMTSGATVRSAFCGPCFGAGDVPANGALSVRHSTRNFPNREGSKPGEGQISSVALMDARSIAATAMNGGVLTAADTLDIDYQSPAYKFNGEVYKNRCYYGFGKARPEEELRFGPNITDWPHMPALTEHLLLKVASFITDPVTTTDELIPSGETSSYRSNPERLSEFALSRKDPAYVGEAKEVRAFERLREEGQDPFTDGLQGLLEEIKKLDSGVDSKEIGIGSLVYAVKPGDGSAREQAASCQKVLGGWANIAQEYATKRYRSNLINWGMLPLLLEGEPKFGRCDWIYIPNVRTAVEKRLETIEGYVLADGDAVPLKLSLGSLTDDERQIILDGCLINYYKNH
ncbi:hydratase [Harryflintia acetispora]|uniref:hydratase n=1 Tax=Harryflintia acetispora TaxID=1849041 RepID=UPI0018977840|nr:hydratase [Harryflintia acetispora]